MHKRLCRLLALSLYVVVTESVVPASVASSDGAHGLVAHEWGTLTSIAGEDGRAVQWVPQAGPDDLPGFVGRIDCNPRFKGSLMGTVRMETPVIYFYAPQALTVNVNVRFRQGIISEWFPKPAHLSEDAIVKNAFGGEIEWTDVKVMPRDDATFRVGSEPNHYYVARETDAAPLDVGGERERFLFYRGVGRLPPAVAVTTAEDQVVVSETRGGALGHVMLFENRDGATAYAVQETAASRTAFRPLALKRDARSPQAQLEKMLVAHGLYPREAKAMVDSWSGSWFEQGTRVLYILPPDAVDAMLPIRIEPQPVELKRVFVGRMEVATPATLGEVKRALETHDARRLKQYGRFLEPFARRLGMRVPAAAQIFASPISGQASRGTCGVARSN